MMSTDIEELCANMDFGNPDDHMATTMLDEEIEKRKKNE